MVIGTNVLTVTATIKINSMIMLKSHTLTFIVEQVVLVVQEMNIKNGMMMKKNKAKNKLTNKLRNHEKN
jgi:hypothetical protein